MSERMLEPVEVVRPCRSLCRISGCLECVAGSVEKLASGDPGADGCQRLSEGAPDEPLVFRDQVRVFGDRVADDERPCHVGPASGLLVPRPNVDVDRQTGGEGPPAGLMPPPPPP